MKKEQFERSINQFNDKQALVIKGEILDSTLLTDDQIDFCIDPEYDPEKMFALKVGFTNGLSKEQMTPYIGPEFNGEQSFKIITDLYYYDFTQEELALYTKPDFTKDQMMQITEGIQKGLTTNQISTYAKPELDQWQMMVKRNQLLEDINKKLKDLITQIVNEGKSQADSPSSADIRKDISAKIKSYVKKGYKLEPALDKVIEDYNN